MMKRQGKYQWECVIKDFDEYILLLHCALHNACDVFKYNFILDCQEKDVWSSEALVTFENYLNEDQEWEGGGVLKKLSLKRALELASSNGMSLTITNESFEIQRIIYDKQTKKNVWQKEVDVEKNKEQDE